MDSKGSIGLGLGKGSIVGRGNVFGGVRLQKVLGGSSEKLAARHSKALCRSLGEAEDLVRNRDRGLHRLESIT